MEIEDNSSFCSLLGYLDQSKQRRHADKLPKQPRAQCRTEKQLVSDVKQLQATAL